VDTGSEVRVKGEGHAGSFGGPPGDLVIITRIQPHPFFSRKGDNLYCEVPITVTEAVLGARVEVPTPNGVTFLILPSGTQSGQLFRLRGKGSSRFHSEGRGDLYVTVRAVIPKEVTPRTEELFRELERLMPDNPRAALFAQIGMAKSKAP
jgi:DnaJ-class molecular chaperone